MNQQYDLAQKIGLETAKGYVTTDMARLKTEQQSSRSSQFWRELRQSFPSSEAYSMPPER